MNVCLSVCVFCALKKHKSRHRCLDLKCMSQTKTERAEQGTDRCGSEGRRGGRLSGAGAACELAGTSTPRSSPW